MRINRKMIFWLFRRLQNTKITTNLLRNWTNVEFSFFMDSFPYWSEKNVCHEKDWLTSFISRLSWLDSNRFSFLIKDMARSWNTLTKFFFSLKNRKFFQIQLDRWLHILCFISSRCRKSFPKKLKKYELSIL